MLRLSRNKLTIEGIPDRVLAESQIHTLTMDGNTDLDERMLRELPGYTKVRVSFAFASSRAQRFCEVNIRADSCPIPFALLRAP